MHDDQAMLDAAGAASTLRGHWRAGTRISGLPDGLRPHSRRDGYDVQAHFDDAPVFGWKIAATSTAGQRHINVPGPLAGRIYDDMVIADGASCSLAGNTFRLAEAEFAFRMARDLAPRAAPYTTTEVLDAVASLHPAIELPDSRFVDVTVAGETQILADDACAHQFVLGPAAPPAWRDVDLRTVRPVARVGTRYTREGLGANVLGDPRDALAWLVNELSGLGLTLRAGEIVTTGTCCVPLEVEPEDALSIDYGTLGSVSLRFTA